MAHRMPLPPPLHEQRERWMTAISASFTTATIWRYARDMLVQTDQLRAKLELGIQKLKSTLNSFWLGPRIFATWERIVHKIYKLFYGWRSILGWLGERKWRNLDFRPEKEQVIKALVVLNFFTPIFLQIYKNSFDTVLECFRRHRRVVLPKQAERRWSTGNQHFYNPRILENRCIYERMLQLYAQRIETALVHAKQNTTLSYNSSKLFKDFVTDVQQNNKQQEEWWAAWGKKYPWSSCRLRYIEEKDSLLWRDNAPEDGVPSWEEDEDLREVFGWTQDE